MYNIDFNLLIVRLLPSFLRKDRMIAWLTSLVAPVADLHGRFIAYRLDKLAEISYNSQTIIFERLLNKAFNTTGIYIENAINNTKKTYIFKLQENERPTYIRKLEESPGGPYIYRLSELVAGSTDFIVFVPKTLLFDESRMRALIEKYKLAGKRYQIRKY